MKNTCAATLEVAHRYCIDGTRPPIISTPEEHPFSFRPIPLPFPFPRRDDIYDVTPFLPSVHEVSDLEPLVHLNMMLMM